MDYNPCTTCGKPIQQDTQLATTKQHAKEIAIGTHQAQAIFKEDEGGYGIIPTSVAIWSSLPVVEIITPYHY